MWKRQYRKQRLLLETVSIIFETKIDSSQIRSKLFELELSPPAYCKQFCLVIWSGVTASPLQKVLALTLRRTLFRSAPNSNYCQQRAVTPPDPETQEVQI
jgi:hypothetical protein